MLALKKGIQATLIRLGHIPDQNWTDHSSAATHTIGQDEERKEHGKRAFNRKYLDFMEHFGITPRTIQVNKPNENGDVEQSHYRFKKAVEQSLLLRGSSDFLSREEYEDFLKKLFIQLNSGRYERFEEELKVLRRLPDNRLDSCKRLTVKVGRGSTIRVNHNVYSVNSRLIGENVHIRLYAEYLQVWYAQKCIEKIPRLRGESKHCIQYRHIIDWLVRKPGAFENYRYRKDLFPTHRFRMAYDVLKKSSPNRANKEYLKILYLAAKVNESLVDTAINELIYNEKPIDFTAVESIVKSGQKLTSLKDAAVDDVDIKAYDSLLCEVV